MVRRSLREPAPATVSRSGEATKTRLRLSYNRPPKNLAGTRAVACTVKRILTEIPEKVTFVSKIDPFYRIEPFRDFKIVFITQKFGALSRPPKNRKFLALRYNSVEIPYLKPPYVPKLTY